MKHKIFLASFALVATTTFFACKKSVSDINYALADPLYGTNSLAVWQSTQLTDSIHGGIWSVSDTSIAKVDQNGLVTGVKAGLAVIKYQVTGAENFSVVDSISVFPSTIVVPIQGGSSVAVGNILPLSDGIQNGTWSVLDPTVATIDANGNVTGVAAGTTIANYTVNNLYANFAASDTLTVY